MDTKTKICPKCGAEYCDHPAISRKDGNAEICPNCGTIEAVEAFLNSEHENSSER